MDELIKQGFMNTDISSSMSIWTVLISIVLSFILCLFIAYVYKTTHRGTSYSQSYVHTMVMMGVIVSVIMLVIGSNIARAFSLVEALSIIRFRNAVKETRDVGFIFFSMAIGMACGTRFYGMAVLSTALIGAMMYSLTRLDVAAMPNIEKILKIHVPVDLDYTSAFNEVFFKHLSDHSMLSTETVRQGMLLELVYSIRFRKGASEREFMEAIRIINGNAKVTIIQGQSNVNI